MVVGLGRQPCCVPCPSSKQCRETQLKVLGTRLTLVLTQDASRSLCRARCPFAPASRSAAAPGCPCWPSRASASGKSGGLGQAEHRLFQSLGLGVPSKVNSCLFGCPQVSGELWRRVLPLSAAGSTGHTSNSHLGSSCRWAGHYSSPCPADEPGRVCNDAT